MNTFGLRVLIELKQLKKEACIKLAYLIFTPIFDLIDSNGYLLSDIPGNFRWYIIYYLTIYWLHKIS